jgi:hypothetical protein
VSSDTLKQWRVRIEVGQRNSLAGHYGSQLLSTYLQAQTHQTGEALRLWENEPEVAVGDAIDRGIE